MAAAAQIRDAGSGWVEALYFHSLCAWGCEGDGEEREAATGVVASMT